MSEDSMFETLLASSVHDMKNSLSLLLSQLDEIGVDPVGLGECHDPAGHVEQIEDCEMLLGLRHPTFVRSDDEQRDIDRLDPGQSDPFRRPVA